MIFSTVSEFGGPDVLRTQSRPDPEPGVHEVLIRVRAAGVNRADLLQREGRYPPPPGAPAWPGLEVAGVVSAVGSGVTSWAVGDEVCALLAGGGYADAVTVHEDLVLPVPAGLTWEEAGGLVEAACTVWSNLQAADARPGETLLVQGGSGGVGHLAIQIAVAAGMRVLATAGGPERVSRCEVLGAVGIDHREGEVSATVRELGGADVILDVLGAGALEDNLRCLRPDGRLLVIGMQRGARGELDLGRLLSLRARVIGTTLRARPHDQKAAIVRSVREDVWPWIPSQVRPVVHAAVPLERAGDAHRLLESGEVFGKVVLTPPVPA
ncbi:NAD(P)H-quinone oxidoreductase [Demequina activiva]|uniref:NAD(P)H quinone oxidoreductase n=1 Tax=Demequina activiva TaxID=1582364 RepID=A0A919UJP2_9MICO|nr:NAD(P)H-quinone oxidoreductase [Demequina activiva]GIG54025.1 NAD(P)H quinone oxidoreductase [Demequina activiva]